MNLIQTKHQRTADIDHFQPLSKIHSPDFGSMQAGLDRFQPISLKELGKAALMDRQETKYIFKNQQIQAILPILGKDYYVLEIMAKRICSYQTVYYDTPDRQFFHQHLNGAGTRWKVRQRTYLDTDLKFIEVKTKDNRKRTLKSRQPVDDKGNWNGRNPQDLISSLTPFKREDLSASLEIRYSRSTLIKKDHTERITIDQDLIFTDGVVTRDLAGLMIAEVKQDSYNPGSPIFGALRSYSIRRTPFSKYCVGMILINPDIKHNRYKPIMRQIDKVIEGDSYEWTH
jgi:hypothetical protein